MFKDCNDNCYFCVGFYIGHCLSDNFKPAQKLQVQNFLNNNRDKIEFWNVEKIENKLNNWPLMWPE